MHIYGLIKTTLLDYPEHLAATIFTGGCSFRCPYCHNSSLIIPNPSEELDIEDILNFLQKRKNILQGVCISGGEPTYHTDLADFIKQIKEMGFLVKLDTNGTNPAVLKELTANNLIDYVAMDIKSSPEAYADAVGLAHMSLDNIKESAAFLMQGKLPYEFRTTVVSELHDAAVIEALSQWIQGCSQYYLQTYKSSDAILSPLPLHACSPDVMEQYASVARKYIKHVSIRSN